VLEVKAVYTAVLKVLAVYTTVYAHHCCRLTTCLENLEMSGNYTDVREMSGISLKVM